MNRKKKLILNTYSSLINEFIIICGFILPRYFM